MEEVGLESDCDEYIAVIWDIGILRRQGISRVGLWPGELEDNCIQVGATTPDLINDFDIHGNNSSDFLYKLITNFCSFTFIEGLFKKVSLPVNFLGPHAW